MARRANVRDLVLDCSTEQALAAAFGRLLEPDPPALLGFGEPTHGVEAFPLFRNDVLAALVERHGFRAIAIESDCLAATIVDDYVCTGAGTLETVLEHGFSHGLGASESNRMLVAWLRDYNSSVPPHRRVRFFGFDGPFEMANAASPRMPVLASLRFLAARLPPARLGHTVEEVEALLGPDADWTSTEAMLDAARSVGGGERARALRLVVDDLVAVYGAERAGLSRASSTLELERIELHLRTAQWLLRYHAVAARPAPSAERTSAMLGQRDAMMAANLFAILESQAQRGPVLAFAQSAHLQRQPSTWDLAGMHLQWWSAGAIVSSALEHRYLHVAADFAGTSAPGTLQSVLADATQRRGLIPAGDLADAIEGLPFVGGSAPDAGYFAIRADELDYLDAVAFINDGELRQG